MVIKFRIGLYLQKTIKLISFNIKYLVFVPYPIKYITKNLKIIALCF